LLSSEFANGAPLPVVGARDVIPPAGLLRRGHRLINPHHCAASCLLGWPVVGLKVKLYKIKICKNNVLPVPEIQ
jgi:hypothetical protein